MRTLSVIAFGFLAAAASAQTPKEIVEKAVQAHGGAEALAKTKAMIQQATGKASFQGLDAEVVREAKCALPDRLAQEIEMTVRNNKLKSKLVLDGLSAWQTPPDGGPPIVLTNVLYDALVDEVYVTWLSTVAPLTRPELTLAAAPAAAVDGQQCYGVKITKAGKPEATLYFNKANGLLMKLSYRGRDPVGVTEKEMLFSDHKVIAGIKVPMRVQHFQQGIRLADWTVKEYRFVDKFDAGTFKKP